MSRDRSTARVHQHFDAHAASYDQQMGAAERWLLGRHRHLDLADACVDTVVATYALCSVPEPRAALLEARRVLRPSGRLLLVEHGPSRSAWLRAVQHALNRLTVRWQSDHLLRVPRELLTDTGFETTEAEQVGVGGLAHRVDARKPAAMARTG